MVSLKPPIFWKRAAILLSSVALAGALGGRAEPQKLAERQNEPDEEFTFRVPVDVVVVNAAVTDDSGNPVTDLTAEDFSLYEDGKRQALQTFSRESHRSIRSAEDLGDEPKPDQAVAPTPTLAASTRPRFISLVIDDVTSPSHGSLKLATSAIRKFVERDLQPGDRVSLLAASGKFNLPFTADRERLLGALRRLPRKLSRRRIMRPDCPAINDLQAQRIFNSIDAWALEAAISEFILCERIAGGTGLQGEQDPLLRNAEIALLGFSEQSTVQRRAEMAVRSLSARIHRENEYWNRQLLQTLASHVRSLQHFEGSKSLVFFSDGFLSQQLRYEVQRVIDAALHGKVIFSTIDIRGLYTTNYTASEAGLMAADDRLPISSMREEDIRIQSLPLAELAHETGGLHVHNSNDFYGGLKRIVESQHFHYVLTYASSANQTDGRYHRIKVKLSRPGLKITHRKGYYASRGEVTFSALKRKEIVEALQAPGNLNEIPIGLSYNCFPLDEERYQIDVFTRVAFGRLPFLEESDRQTNLLNLVTVAYKQDEKERYMGGQEKQLDLKLNAAALDALRGHELTSKVTLQLPPGRYQLKTVVRESVKSTVGSVQKKIVVPENLTKLSTSTEGRGLMAALTSATPKTELPLRFRTYIFYESPQLARLHISARIEAGAIHQPAASEGFELAGVAYGPDGRLASLFNDTVRVKGEGAIRFSRQMRLRPGRYRLKLGVADIKGRMGTAEEELTLAAMEPHRLASSSLVASQELQEIAPSVFDLQSRLTDEADPLVHQGFQIQASADNRVEGTHPLAIFYRLYNLESEAKEARLVAKVRLVDEEGSSQEFPPVLLNRAAELTPEKEVHLALQLPTGDLAPGKYRLVVETRDLSSGQSILSESQGLEIVGSTEGPAQEEALAQLSSPKFDFPQPGVEDIEESVDYQAILESKTPTQKAALIETFFGKHPQSKRVAELREQATWLYWQMNQFHKVVEHGETTLEASPSNPQVLTILTTAYHALNRPVQVIRRASRAVRSLRQLNRPAYMNQDRWKSQIDDLLAKNYAFMGSAYLSQYETDRLEASNHQAVRNLDKAYVYSTQAVDLDPRSDFAQFQLGIVFCASNRAHEALGSLAKAVVLKGRFKDIARQNLESVYKLVNGGSLEGLDDLLARARADLTVRQSSSL